MAEPAEVTVRKIHEAMDGAEWNADLWDVIAEIFREAGWPEFRHPE